MATTTLGRGPRPTRTDRPRAAALRVLRRLVEAGEALTVAQLAQHVGGHPNAVRAHLEVLETAGFVVAKSLPARGRGRPAQAYTATLDGRQIATQDNEPSELSLLEAVADHLAATENPIAGALQVGRAWGARVGETDAATLLARQGFTPESTADGIRLLTCPLLTAARHRPEIICGIHQGLLEATSERRLRLEPFGAADSCLAIWTSDDSCDGLAGESAHG